MGDCFPVVLVSSQGAYLTDGQYCSSAFWSTDGLHYLFCGHSRDKSEFDVQCLTACCLPSFALEHTHLDAGPYFALLVSALSVGSIAYSFPGRTPCPL